MFSIREDLLHYIWRTKRFVVAQTTTINGQAIDIISVGQHNHHAGPDFLNAQIYIDEVLWVGHVEIHIRASDWLRHRHDTDEGYENVVLHVVWSYDTPITRPDGTEIPCMELKPYIDPGLLARYEQLYRAGTWIPCEDQILDIHEIVRYSAVQRALAARLEERASRLSHDLAHQGQNLHELIYQRLAWSMGLKVNAEAMLLLAQSVPYQIISKHRDHLDQIEALLLGQSGLIDKDADHPYVQKLVKEYEALSKKYGLDPMNSTHWKYARMRPAAFPTIRIAQLAGILHKLARMDDLLWLDDSTIEVKPHIKAIHKLMEIDVSPYWKTHYRFGEEGEHKNKRIGSGTRDSIIINVIAPLLFMRGSLRHIEEEKERAVALLEQVKPEHNNITQRWENLGMKHQSAADTQGLIHLKKSFCDHHLCLSCPIGHKIMIQ